MPDVACLGELLVDFVPPEAADIRHAESFRRAAGGAPANVAVGLARLGVASAFIGQVGDDGFGRFLADTLREAGVDVGPLRLTSRAATRLAFVSLAADGERDFMFYGNADQMLAPEDIDEATVAGVRLLHFGSISLIAEPSRSATLHALDLAHRHGKLVSYDPNLRLNLWPDPDTARAGLRVGFGHAHVIKIAEAELDFLTGLSDPLAGARALWRDPLRLLVVTRGAAGCLWVTAEAHGDVPGIAVEAVDATGAGDAFTAALLAGLIDAGPAFDRATLDRICRQANVAGALATTSRGAIPSLPTREVLEATLARWTP